MVAKTASLSCLDQLLRLEIEIGALIGGMAGQVSPSPLICFHLGPTSPSNVTYYT